MADIIRCDWAKTQQDIHYHDHFWGVPMRDDAMLFEMLILEGMQAGLSWSTVLAKRDGMRDAFDNFDYNIIAAYTEEKLEELRSDSRIIRNKAKIASMPVNARAFIKIREEHGSFSNYIWAFVNNKPIQNKFEKLSDIPANTPLSDKISGELKKKGFKFFGSTTCYAFMQAVGISNDHLVSCVEYEKCKSLGA